MNPLAVRAINAAKTAEITASVEGCRANRRLTLLADGAGASLRGAVTIVLAILVVAGVRADETAASEQEEDPGLLTDVSEMMDDARKTAGDRLNGFIYGIDSFFGASEEVGDPNQSYARVRAGLKQKTNGEKEVELDGTVKLRVVLPRTEKRVRLLFSSEDDNESSGAAANREELTRDDGENLALALRFIRSARENGRVSFDLGARMRDDKPQIFGRIDSRYEDNLTRKWRLRLGNDIYWYSDSGYDIDFNIDVRRPLKWDETVFFRTSTGFNWLEGSKGASIGETLGVYASFGETKALAVETLWRYNTALNDGASDYFLGTEFRLRWRHNIWRDWFYYELWPSVGWPASNDYEKAYGFLARIEVEIGER